MRKDRAYLHEMYNATSVSDDNGGIETYENWLERQLLSRIGVLEEIEAEDKFTYILESKPNGIFTKNKTWLTKEFYDSYEKAKNHLDLLVSEHHYSKEDLRIVAHQIY